MDPVSHLVFGRALAALAPRPADDRGLTMAIVVGSIAPDVDAVLMPVGWDWYLLWHQRGTHALVGTIIVSLALAGLLWLLLRLPERRREQRERRVHRARAFSTARSAPAPTPAPARPADGAPAAADAGSASHHQQRATARFRYLWLAAWIGALGHITLDLVSGGTIRLFAPFDLAPSGLPLTAMADPLLALPLLAFLLTALIWKRNARRAAVVLLLVLAGVLALKSASERVARRVYRDTVAARADGATLQAVEARWGTFFGWAFYDQTPTRLRAWAVDARTGDATLAVTRPRPMADLPITDAPAATDSPLPDGPGGPADGPADGRPGGRAGLGAPDAARAATLVAASRDLETVRHFFTLFDLPLVETRPSPPGDRDAGRGASDGDVDVLWSDIRFCWATDCALWFGGTFDADGRPRSQLVIIGRVRQRRPVQ